MSVLIKYSGLQAQASGTHSFFMVKDSGNNVIGVKNASENSLQIKGYYVASSEKTYTFLNGQTLPASGYILFSFDSNKDTSTHGASVWVGESLGSLSGGWNSGLFWNGKNPVSISLGGPHSVDSTSSSIAEAAENMPHPTRW